MKVMVLLYWSVIKSHRCVVSCLVALLTFLHAGAVASSAVPDTDASRTDSLCAFTEKILFPWSSSVVSPDFAGNQVHMDSIRWFLSGADAGSLVSVRIVGSYSPEGKRAFNTKLARARALALAEVVKGINPSLSPVESVIPPIGGTDYRHQRFAELQVLYHYVPAGIAAADGVSAAETAPTAAEESLPDTAAETGSQSPRNIGWSAISDVCGRDSVAGAGGTLADASVARRGFADRLFATTNMLYDAMLTPNIGVGVKIADRVTVLADWMYARWNNRDKRRYWRIYGGDIEARYRIGRRKERSPLGGHHVGVYGSMACYDFQGGRSHKGVLSDKWNYAVGVSYAYSLPVSTHFNIDFSIGFGYAWGIYKKHRPIDDCDVWLSTHKLRWFGPTKAGVSLVWLIGKSVKNSRKGGDR